MIGKFGSTLRARVLHPIAHHLGPRQCRGHCPRCDAEVDVQVPARGWRYAFRAWLGGLGLGIALFPVIASDWCLMTPSFMAFLTAGGPLRRFAFARPMCRSCSLEFDETPPSVDAALGPAGPYRSRPRRLRLPRTGAARGVRTVAVPVRARKL